MHPADLSANSGSLQLPPNITHQSLERLRHGTEVPELITGKTETCPYTCLSDPRASALSTGTPGPKLHQQLYHEQRVWGLIPPLALNPLAVTFLRAGGQRGPSAHGQGLVNLQVHSPWHIGGNRGPESSKALLRSQSQPGAVGRGRGWGLLKLSFLAAQGVPL